MKDIKIFRTGKAERFDSSARLPESAKEAKQWQEANQTWWHRNPNRYDFDDAGKIPHEEYTDPWYKEIDFRFLVRDAKPAMGWRNTPFDSFIDFDRLRSQEVLEVGTGCGSHSQLLSTHAKSYTGIDLTPYAVECTRRRFRLYGLGGSIHQMDVERMSFPDESFDFVWSWGVIHHTSDTSSAIRQIARVLRPGGTFVSMVYHRSMWNTVVRGGIYYGFLKGDFLKGKSLDRIIQDRTDGALARYYTIPEWTALLSEEFNVDASCCIGSKSQLVPLGMGTLKRRIMNWIPDTIGRGITNRPLFGFLLVTSATRKVG